MPDSSTGNQHPGVARQVKPCRVEVPQRVQARQVRLQHAEAQHVAACQARADCPLSPCGRTSAFW
jgi:hypothetical protein